MNKVRLLSSKSVIIPVPVESLDAQVALGAFPFIMVL